MKNSYGLDVSYFKGKLELVLRDIKNYTPDELARELARYSSAADKTVMLEPEFNQQAARMLDMEADNDRLDGLNMAQDLEIKQQTARIEALENLLRMNSDLIRCGIGANYGGECYDEKLAMNHQPVLDALANTTTATRSRVECDGQPTFYISAEGMVCTHRLSENDTPVWCRSGDDGLAAMQSIQNTTPAAHHNIYDDLVSLQALNNANDGSIDVHDAIAALITKVDEPAAQQDDNQIKADAIKRFVSTMIGALEAGFVEDATPTLAEIHRFARHHINDNYGIDTPNISDEWGEEVAAICAAEHLQSPQETQS